MPLPDSLAFYRPDGFPGAEFHAMDMATGDWWFTCSMCGQSLISFSMRDITNHKYFTSETGKTYCFGCKIKIEKDIEDASGGKLIELPSVEIQVPPEYMTAMEDELKGAGRKKLEAWPHVEQLTAIIGNPGSGKTRACWAVAKRMARHGRRVEIFSFNQAKSLWVNAHGLNGGRDKVESMLLGARWLILDDLSAVKPTEGWKEFLHTLFEERITHARPTLITTACDGNELEEHYGYALRSRLNRFMWIKLPKVDHRMKKSGKPKLNGSLLDEEPAPNVPI